MEDELKFDCIYCNGAFSDLGDYTIGACWECLDDQVWLDSLDNILVDQVNCTCCYLECLETVGLCTCCGLIVCTDCVDASGVCRECRVVRVSFGEYVVAINEVARAA